MTEEKRDEAITGELTRIVFSNETGFLIGSFKTLKTDELLGTMLDTFTATGTIVNPQILMTYKLFGSWTNNPRYGEQFAFTRFETEVPSDPDGIFKYLVRCCKYVGSTVGQALVNKYGPQTIEIMKTDPDRVAKDISGITKARASEIQKTLVENEANEKVMIELEALLDVQGMLKNLPGKLYTEYLANAAEKVKENPYRLIRFPMVGFALADRVALHIGFSRTSIERKKAAALHIMAENAQNGNTWINVKTLLQNMVDLLQIVGLEDGINALVHDGIIILEDQHVAFRGPATDERLIASKATLMLSKCVRQAEQEIPQGVAA